MILLVFLTILASILYKFGGGGFDLWMKFRFLPQWCFDSKARDVGVPLCMMAYMAFHWHWVLIFCFGLMWGSQTSYFKKRGSDARFYNWIFVGLAFSLALLPYSIAIGNLPGFLLRSIIVTVFVPVWSVAIGRDWLEEGGRGAVQIATLPLLIPPH